MKAIIHTEYGSPDVLHLQAVPTPTPQDNEVLVKIRASTVNYGDILARNFKSVTPRQFNMPSIFWLPARIEFGWNKPKKSILGAEFAGEVAAVGKAVTRFKVGDQVFGYLGSNFGGYAEYVAVSETATITLKPANLTFEEAVTLPYGMLTALNLLKKVNIQPGQKVLINGASGGIGSAAVQLAKYYGAEVTGVCGTPRMEFVTALGADHVIDYTKEDFTRSGETYDLIFDILGKSSFASCKRVLKPNGRYLLASFKLIQFFQMLWTSRFSSQKVICALSMEKPEDFVFIKELIEAGKLKAFIDRCYPLEQTADAHRYVESGQKQGPVVITVAS